MIKKLASKLKKEPGSKMQEAGLAYLGELGIQAPIGTFVDLGTYRGASAVMLACVSATGDVYTVDNYHEGPDATKHQGPYPSPDDVRDLCSGLGVQVLIGDTAAVTWVKPPVTLVFVDADHRRAGLERDIERWKPEVVVGGIMAFDDYGSARWPDVKPVVDEHFADWRRLGVKGGVAAFKRVK